MQLPKSTWFGFSGLILCCAAGLAGCAAATTAGTHVDLRLIAFNDFHGNIQAVDPSPGRVPVSIGSGTEMVESGGAAYLASTISRERSGHVNSMVISAGDLTGASPLLSALLKDEPTIRVMNLIGLDLNAVGNHEFDGGREELVRKSGGGCLAAEDCRLGTFAGADFPYLAANVIDETSGKPLFSPYVVRTFEGVRVGFIGVVTRETPNIVSRDGVLGLRFLDEAETLNRYAGELAAKGINAVVAVLHEGATPAPETPADGRDCAGLAGALTDIVRRTDRRVDVFISAHTHESYACRLDGRLLTQALSYGRMLSVIDLTLDAGTGDVATATGHNVPVTRDIVPDPVVEAEVRLAEASAGPIRAQDIAVLPHALTRDGGKTGESALGDVIADAQLEAGRKLGAVIAFTNPGGIRQDLPSDVAAGLAVDLGDIFAVQPFGNSLVAMDLSGAELKLLLEQQWLGQPADRKPRMLQISNGFSYCYDDSRPEGDRILGDSLRLSGAAILPAKDYRIVVNSYLAGGGDRFAALSAGRHKVQGGGDLDALREYIVGHAKTLPGTAQGRVCRRG